MTKEAKIEYLNIVNNTIWADSKSMQEYITKKCSDVFKTSNGNLIKFEKPTIKKRFCFGHGQNGVTTQEETETAINQAEYARTNEQYFLNKNLEDINRKIKTYSEAEKLFILPQYRQYDIKNIGLVVTADYFRHYDWQAQEIMEELSEADKQELLRICESEKAKFIKRLQTYLKKYGLSKVQTWSYLVD